MSKGRTVHVSDAPNLSETEPETPDSARESAAELSRISLAAMIWNLHDIFKTLPAKNTKHCVLEKDYLNPLLFAK
jgi:hypothetical protein